MGEAVEAVTKHEFSQFNFWTPRLRRGPGKTFTSPQELLNCADEYFNWANEHPLKAGVVFHHKGSLTHGTVCKMRVFTLTGLCTFLGISPSTFENYRRDKEMQEATEIIDSIIKTQKFEGAAADLLNANLIARDLGLAERSQVSGPGNEPLVIVHRNMTVQEAATAYADMVSDAGQR